MINVLENSVQLEESRCKKYLNQLRELMEKVKEKNTIGRKELASLVGKLNFAAPFYWKGPGAKRKLGAALYEPKLHELQGNAWAPSVKVHWTDRRQRYGKACK